MPENFSDLMRYEDMGTVDVKDQLGAGNKSPFIELGATGLRRTAGILDEEFLPALRGRKAVKVYREMSSNDPIIGALLFAIDKLIRQVVWRVESNDNTPDQAQAVQFLEECMDDMSHTWNDMVSEILSMLVYGWSWHEIVYKKRVGPWEKDPKKQSKYTDGKIGWRKIPIRSQETTLRWIFDDTGGIQGMVQIPPPYYQQILLPINRCLLFRTGLYKGNPEGISLLRTAYRPWFIKKRLEEFEAIGVERDLAGMPVAQVPASYMRAKEGSQEEKIYKAYKKMVQNVRRDEHDGLVLPLEYDEKGKELFKFELMSSTGTRAINTNDLIQRYEQRILMTVLADFIMVGHEGVGSYAMHVDKTGIFRAALNVITDAIADVFNRFAIPKLFELNAWKLDALPRIVPNNVDPPNLTELASFMSSMAGMGMAWFPDPDLEKFLRETAHLPELPEDVMEQRRVMAEQNNLMNYASSMMELAGMEQKAYAVDAGMTPEQAFLAAAQPTEHMTVAEQEAQAVGAARGQMRPESQQAADLEQQRQLAFNAQDPMNQAKLDGEKTKQEWDFKNREQDFKFKEKDAKRQDWLKEREAKRSDHFAERAAKRDDKFKDKDVKRTNEVKDRDAKRAVFMSRLKERSARTAAAANANKKPPARKKP